jgi:hypothetical protein
LPNWTGAKVFQVKSLKLGSNAAKRIGRPGESVDEKVHSLARGRGGHLRDLALPGERSEYRVRRPLNPIYSMPSRSCQEIQGSVTSGKT